MDKVFLSHKDLPKTSLQLDSVFMAFNLYLKSSFSLAACAMMSTRNHNSRQQDPYKKAEEVIGSLVKIICQEKNPFKAKFSLWPTQRLVI